MQTQKKSFKQKVWTNLVILLVSLFVGLILVEAGLAIFIPFPDYIIIPEPYVEDPELFYRFKSNGELSQNGDVFYTDPNGFRILDPEDYPQADDQIILFIGDSQTFGWLLRTEDTFAYKTEVQLQQLGHDIHTVNASSPGWNVWHYQTLLDLGGDLYPNLTAVVIYLVANDWEPKDNHHVEDGYMERDQSDASRFIPKSVKVSLSRFHFWRYFTLAWRNIRDRNNDTIVVEDAYSSKWTEEIEPLTYILEETAASKIPLFVIIDERITEVDAIMKVLSQSSVAGLINMGDLDGGRMYDSHIDVDKHDAVTSELVRMLLDSEVLTTGE